MTVLYRRNNLFAFIKSVRSFLGVEPIAGPAIECAPLRRPRAAQRTAGSGSARQFAEQRERRAAADPLAFLGGETGNRVEIAHHIGRTHVERVI